MMCHMVYSFTGPPSEPSITYNGSSLCFSAHAHEEFPVENFTTEIIDITGVPIILIGTYNTRGTQCHSVLSDPIPDLCLPFWASVSATNAVGTNSNTTEFFPLENEG